MTTEWQIITQIFIRFTNIFTFNMRKYLDIKLNLKHTENLSIYCLRFNLQNLPHPICTNPHCPPLPRKALAFGQIKAKIFNILHFNSMNLCRIRVRWMYWPFAKTFFSAIVIDNCWEFYSTSVYFFFLFRRNLCIFKMLEAVGIQFGFPIPNTLNVFLKWNLFENNTWSMHVHILKDTNYNNFTFPF